MYNQKYNVMNNAEKYFIPDSYPMIEEEVIEEIIVLNKAEDIPLPNMIYMPWQVINEAPTIGFNNDEKKI